MALVTAPTLPFAANDLDLENSLRWRLLMPLMQPASMELKVKNGAFVPVNGAIAERSDPVIVLRLSSQTSPSSFLKRGCCEVFYTSNSETQYEDPRDVIKTLIITGLVGKREAILLAADGNIAQACEIEGRHALYAQVEGEVRLNHLLQTLTAATASTRSSFHRLTELIQSFIANVEQRQTTVSGGASDKQFILNRGEQTLPLTSAKEAVSADLDALLVKVPVEKDLSVHLADINGLARSEHHILAFEIYNYLQKTGRPFLLSQTSIALTNPPNWGWVISVATVPTGSISLTPPITSPLKDLQRSSAPTRQRFAPSKIQFVDADVRRRLEAGCQALIAEEPRITEYDTIVGDADCGYTLRDGAKEVLRLIKDLDLADLPTSLGLLVDDLQVNMGGTSGALYCIFLSQLTQTLTQASTFVEALQQAMEHLFKFTKARRGDRTMMDCLIPFVEALKSGADPREAVTEAKKGVERTKKMEAKLGRSTYLDNMATEGVPDPGAYGLLVLLQGIVG